MAGLFGKLNQANMGLASGLLSGGGYGSFNSAIARGIQGYQQGTAQEEEDRMRQEKFGLLKAHAERQAQLHQQQQQDYEAQQASAARTAQGMGQVRSGLMLNPGNYAEAIKGADQLPVTVQMGLLKEAQALQPKAEAFTLGEGQRRFVGGQEVASVPKSIDMNQLVIPDGSGGFKLNEMRQKALIEQRMAGRNNVSTTVNGVDTVKNARDLRNDYNNHPTTKNYNELRRTFEQMKTSLGKGTGIGDIASVVKINKMLDPTSVVRESEFAIAMEATGKLDRIMQYGQQMINGTKLSPQARADYFDLVSEFMRGSEQEQKRLNQEAQGFAKSFGMSPDRIAPPLTKIDYTSPLRSGASAPNAPVAPGANRGGASGSYGFSEDTINRAQRYLK